MKIQTLVNFRFKNGDVLIAGIHDDTDTEFPEQLYVEIERHQNGEVKPEKLKILDDRNISKKSAPAQDINTLENDDDVVNVHEVPDPAEEEPEKPKPKTKRKRTVKKK